MAGASKGTAIDVASTCAAASPERMPALSAMATLRRSTSSRVTARPWRRRATRAPGPRSWPRLAPSIASTVVEPTVSPRQSVRDCEVLECRRRRRQHGQHFFLCDVCGAARASQTRRHVQSNTLACPPRCDGTLMRPSHLVTPHQSAVTPRHTSLECRVSGFGLT